MSIQAIQIDATLYLIDCLSVGKQTTIFDDRNVLKITSAATKTGLFFNKVTEVSS